jgi:hypothetical protein
VQEDFQRHLLQMCRWAALAAILLTSICTAAVLSWQLTLGVSGRDWTLLSVREVLESGAQSSEQYTTASIVRYNALDAAAILEWVLDLPAMLMLVLVLGLLLVYYRYLRSVEKTLSGA